MRKFLDAAGVIWQVWAVTPLIPERPIDGWLAFESKFEKRRLRPIPSSWESSSDEELQTLLGAALPAPSSHRLIG